jgi:hypothetical protein
VHGCLKRDAAVWLDADRCLPVPLVLRGGSAVAITPESLDFKSSQAFDRPEFHDPRM